MCKITGSGSGEGHFLIYSWHFLCASSCDGIQSEALKERKRERKRERKEGRKKEEKERKRATLLRGKLRLTHYMCKYGISGALQYMCLSGL